MTTENTIRLFAGFVILLSLALGTSPSPLFHSAHWLWVTAFVGANLLQSSLTGFCPLERMLARCGMRSGGAACAR